MDDIKLDFSMFSQGEDKAVLPMTLVQGLVRSLPAVDDYGYKRNLSKAIEKASTLEERAEVLKTAYMMTMLQLEFKEPEKGEMSAEPLERNV